MVRAVEIPKRAEATPTTSSFNGHNVWNTATSPQRKAHMRTLYFDWSMNRGLAVVNETGGVNDVITYKSITDLLDSLSSPARLISESTFESFNVDKRNALVERVAREGHEWFVTPTRQTPRARKALGLEKDDTNDVIAIRHVATSQPDGLKRPTVHSPLASASEAACYELMLLRREYETVDAPRRATGFKVIKAKDTYAQQLIDLLPPYHTLDPNQKIALGDGKTYALPLVAAAGKATKFAHSRREFESIAGLFANGYPNQIRSDIHHWRWRFVRKARDEKGKHNLTLSEFRKSVRWLYHRLDNLRDHL